MKKQTLSNANRTILENCARRHLSALEKLHWRILPYLYGKKKLKERSIQHDILSEIGKETLATEKAIEALNETYMCQFPKSRRETRFPQKRNPSPLPG